MGNNVLGSPPPAVLKSRGVPIKVHVLAKNDEDRWVRSMDGDEPVIDTVYVQMTNAVLTDLTDPLVGYGSLDLWQHALSNDTYRALQNTLAMCLDWWIVLPGGQESPDGRRAGRAMIDGEVDSYSSAIGAAFMLANGVRPERVGEVMAAGITSAAGIREQMMDKLADAAMEAAQESTDRLKAALDADADETTPTSPSSPTDTPSSSGSPHGSEQVATPASSGG